MNGTRQHDEDTGWNRVQLSQKRKEEASQFDLRDELLEDGWSVKVDHILAGGKGQRGKMMMSEMHSNGSLVVFAPVIFHEKGTDISVLVQDWNGCLQSRRRFLHQLGDTPVMCQSTAPQGGNLGDEERSKLF